MDEQRQDGSCQVRFIIKIFRWENHRGFFVNLFTTNSKAFPAAQLAAAYIAAFRTFNVNSFINSQLWLNKLDFEILGLNSIVKPSYLHLGHTGNSCERETMTSPPLHQRNLWPHFGQVNENVAIKHISIKISGTYGKLHYISNGQFQMPDLPSAGGNRMPSYNSAGFYPKENCSHACDTLSPVLQTGMSLCQSQKDQKPSSMSFFGMFLHPLQ